VRTEIVTGLRDAVNRDAASESGAKRWLRLIDFQGPYAPAFPRRCWIFSPIIRVRSTRLSEILPSFQLPPASSGFFIALRQPRSLRNEIVAQLGARDKAEQFSHEQTWQKT
jgi:hypothetical protein